MSIRPLRPPAQAVGPTARPPKREGAAPRGYNGGKASRAIERLYNMIDAVSQGAYEAVRRGAGLIDRSDRGRVVVSGHDRAEYLQGLLSNDIVALKPGGGCYATYLTPQGRMIADLLVYELGDLILLTMSGDVKAAVLSKLDQFIFSEDVQLGDVTESFGQCAVVGPGA